MRRFVPRFLTLVLTLVIVCASACADTVYALCRPGDIVHVREYPSSRSTECGRLDCGDAVETDWKTRKDKHGGKWLHVIGFEGDAWVSARYLSSSPVIIADGDCYAYVCANGRTALRRAPNGKRTKWLKTGTELRVLAYTDEWVLTTRGYVKADCVEVDNGTLE